MGAFFLIRDALPGDALVAHAKLSMARQGFHAPTLRRAGNDVLCIYGKTVATGDNLLDFGDDEFCACTGTLVYRSCHGGEALRRVYRDFGGAQFGLDDAFGSFCLVLRKAGLTYICTDRLGIYKVYASVGGRVWSSSFLTAASVLQTRTLNRQAVYEYVFQGATYGDETILEEIELVSGDLIYEIGDVLHTRARAGRLPETDPTVVPGDHLERVLSELRTCYRAITQCFGNRIDTALSGGYDSRLTYALLREQGVTPKVHVYGTLSDADVRVAMAIDRKEKIGLQHIDKTARPRLDPPRFADAVEENYYAFDGYPVDGIFRDAEDLASRRQRCEGGELMLNGGGGEIFRNFFYLRDGRFTVQQLLWAFYSGFSPRSCTRAFSETAYHARLGAKIKAVLATTHDTLDRRAIELLFPLFRCRYWMGRNNAVNNRLGYAMTPFIDYRVVRSASHVPLRRKNFGRFQAALIRAVDPVLARYPSAYGHNFASHPPASRIIADLTTHLRPTRIRRYTYRVKERLRRHGPPRDYLSEPYVNEVLQGRERCMDEYFHVARIHDWAQLARILTLEFLLSRLEEDGYRTP